MVSILFTYIISANPIASTQVLSSQSPIGLQFMFMVDIFAKNLYKKKCLMIKILLRKFIKVVNSNRNEISFVVLNIFPSNVEKLQSIKLF